MEQEKVLSRVRALLERANHPGTPETEADACRLKADEYMQEYAIEQAELDATRPAADRIKPEYSLIKIVEPGNPLWEQLTDLASRLALHCRCRDVFYGMKSKGRLGIDIGLIGYAADIKYFEMLYTSLYLQLSANLEPKPNPFKSLAENVYILHEAGVKWRRMANLLNREWDEMDTQADIAGRGAAWRKEVRPSKDQPGVLIPWPDGHRLINLYRKHCREIGEEPHAIQSPINYQRNFAESFRERVSMRLWEMDARNNGAGTALALRRDLINEKYEEMFKDIKAGPKRKPLRYEWNARDAGDEAGRRADLGGTRVQGNQARELS